MQAAENNRRINERLISLERSARLYQVLKSADSLQLITQNLQRFESTLRDMTPLVEEAFATELASSVGIEAAAIVAEVSRPAASDAELIASIQRFEPLSQTVNRLNNILTAHIDNKLSVLQETARNAQRVSAWQVAALVPGTFNPGIDLHIAGCEADSTDRQGHRSARRERFLKAYFDQGTHRPATTRPTARMVATALTGAGAGKKQIPAAYVS